MIQYWFTNRGEFIALEFNLLSLWWLVENLETSIVVRNAMGLAQYVSVHYDVNELFHLATYHGYPWLFLSYPCRAV